MGNIASNKIINVPIVVNIKYSKLEKLIRELKKNSDNLNKSKIKTFEELENNEYKNNFINYQEEINNEIIKIRKSISNNANDINEYTKSTIKLKNYIFEIQTIVKIFFEIVRNKSALFKRLNLNKLFNFL